jgi:hypothetical protein
MGPTTQDDLLARDEPKRTHEEPDRSPVMWMRASFARIHRSIDCAAGLEPEIDQSLVAIRFHRVRD